MKIKKKTSIMMLAASTAAVIGVAAVSYAQWQGNGNTTLTAQASTGEAYLFGFVSPYANAETENKLPFEGKLVPHDQKDETIVEGGQKVVTATLPDYVAYEAYSITLDQVAIVGKDGATVQGEYSIYAQIGDAAGTAADWTSATDTNNPWKLISDTDGFTFENLQASTETNKVVSGKIISLLLVSEAQNEDAKSQMGATFTFSITLTSGATTND